MERNAYFAGGCFWCVTPVFRSRKGVLSVTSGYCGGDETDPTYEAVKSQTTGHRETVRIVYDDALISFDRLLAIFLDNVDPFDGGGQFIDRGRSYTLAVYFADETEKEAACRALDALAQSAGRTPCVAVEPYKRFYPAEEFHQDYFLKNPEAFAEELRTSGRAPYRPSPAPGSD
jgi:methionine-S-sulfoxide reductase